MRAKNNCRLVFKIFSAFNIFLFFLARSLVAARCRCIEALVDCLLGNSSLEFTSTFSIHRKQENGLIFDLHYQMMQPLSATATTAVVAATVAKCRKSSIDFLFRANDWKLIHLEFCASFNLNARFNYAVSLSAACEIYIKTQKHRHRAHLSFFFPSSSSCIIHMLWSSLPLKLLKFWNASNNLRSEKTSLQAN